MKISTEKVKTVFCYASIFEGSFSIDWIIELTGFKASEVIKALNAGEQEEVLKRCDLDRYRFANLDKQKQYRNSLSKKEIKSQHKRMTIILLDEVIEDPSILRDLLIHFLSSENGIDGCRWLLWAGSKIYLSYGRRATYRCYHKAVMDLKHCNGKEADELFIEAVIKFSQFIKDDYLTRQEDSALLAEALKRAEKWKYDHYAGALYILTAINNWFLNNCDQAVRDFEKGVSIVESIDHPELAREINSNRILFHFLTGAFKETIRLYEQHLPDIDTYIGYPFGYMSTLVVSLSYAFIGQPSQGLGIANAMYEYSLNIDNHMTAYLSEIYMGHILLEFGRPREALKHYLNVKSDLELQPEDSQLVWKGLLLAIALAHLREGNRGQVRDIMIEFGKLEASQSLTSMGIVFLIKLRWEQHQQNSSEKTLQLTSSAIDHGLHSANAFVRGIAYRYHAEMLNVQGEAGKAVVAALNESIWLLDETGYTVEMIRSRLVLIQELKSMGRHDAADRRMREIKFLLGLINREFISSDLLPLIDNIPEDSLYLDKLYSFSLFASDHQSESEMIQRIILTVSQLTGAERGAVFTWDSLEPGTIPTMIAAKNLPTDEITSDRFTGSLSLIQKCQIERMIQTGKNIIDIDEANPSSGSILSQIVIPIRFKGQVNGCLYFDNRLIPNSFEKYDQRLFSYFANQAAMIVEILSSQDTIGSLRSELAKEREYLKPDKIRVDESFSGIIGKSSLMEKVFNQIEQAAPTESTVLIMGETGVGKELVARAIHERSRRSNGPFIRVNCSALSVNLISSELFGHEKGAFTGADRRHKGRFELADGGTIFLDEIGDIPLEVQVSLLRVIQTREFQRVGGTETLQSDFRLLAATNRDLEKESQNGHFREDLFYRLNVFPIVVPPLRDRQEDIPLLVSYFLNRYAAQAGKRFYQIRQSEIDQLLYHDWPGNIRELENAVERGVIMSEGADIRMPPLTPAFHPPAAGVKGITLREMERNHLLWALKKTKGKVYGKGGAAELLDLHPNTLNSKMKRLDIRKNQDDPAAGGKAASRKDRKEPKH